MPVSFHVGEWGFLQNPPTEVWAGDNANGALVRGSRKSDGSFKSRTNINSIVDGTSNTFLAGERPPSWDLYYGWWYAGAGQWDFSFGPIRNTGSCDVTLGTEAVSDASTGHATLGHSPPRS